MSNKDSNILAIIKTNKGDLVAMKGTLYQPMDLEIRKRVEARKLKNINLCDFNLAFLGFQHFRRFLLLKSVV